MTVPDTAIEPCWACGSPAEPDPTYSGEGYARCTRCGFMFQPERSADALQDLYDEEYFEEFAGGGDYAAEDAQRRNEARVRLEHVRSFAPPPARLLEIGSAAGHFLDAAARAGYAPLGVEPVAEFAASAQSNFGVEVITGFLEEVDLPDEPFDVACGFHVLEHISRPLPALERMRQALRPGGTLFLEVPNIDSAEAARLTTRWGALEPLHHVGHYAPQSMRAMLEKAGFTDVRTDTVPFFTYLRPRAAAHPRELAHRAVLSLRARVAPRGPHPTRHELLRAVARVP